MALERGRGPAWPTSLSGVRPRAQACRSACPPVSPGPPQTALHSGVSGLSANVSGAQSPACSWEGATPKPAQPRPLHPRRELPVNQTPVWVLPFLQRGQPGAGGGVGTGPRAHHHSAWLSVQRPVLPRAQDVTCSETGPLQTWPASGEGVPGPKPGCPREDRETGMRPDRGKHSWRWAMDG